ncbi:MAG: carboxypeptidase regulatory-like domain-containing protein [Ardenticatenaceae bacterium]
MPFPVIGFRQGLRLLAAIFVALVGLALVNVTMAQLHAPEQAKHALPGELPTSETTKPSEAETVQFAELAAATGGMAGFVTAPGGAPLSEIEVEAYQKQPWGWEQVRSTTTDPSGRYLLQPLDKGVYRLRFEDSFGAYAFEYYGHAQTINNATDIPISGKTVAEINIVFSPLRQSSQDAQSERAALDLPSSARSSIAGTLTAPDGNPLAGIEVEAYREQPWGWEQVRSTTSDAKGKYQISLVEKGIYRLRFEDEAGIYAEYYGHAQTLNEAADIPLFEDQVTDIDAVFFSPTTTSIDLTGKDRAQANQRAAAQLMTTGGISGTVTASDGSALSGINVTAYQHQPSGNWGSVRSVNTDGSGKYVIPALDTAVYRLRFYRPSGAYAFEYYDNAQTLDTATYISVIGDMVTDIDAVLSPAGHISGTVTMFDGNPPDQAWIRIYYHNGSSWDQVGSQYLSGGRTNYDVSGLATGSYRIRVYGYYYGRYFNEYYDNADSLNNGADVSVTAGSTTPDINFVLGEGSNFGSITGTVTSLAGDALSAINVTAYISQTRSWRQVRAVNSDSSGRYELPALDSGIYALRFYRASSDYAFEYYDEALTLSDATPISLTAGATINNLNATLSPAGHISGTVTMFDGNPPDQAWIRIYYHNGSSWDQVGSQYLSGGRTNYDVSGLATGSYRIRVYGYYYGRFFNEYYDNADSLNNGTDVSVTAGNTTPNINVVLGQTNTGRVSGTVTANGVAQKGIKIDLYQDYTGRGDWWRLVFAHTDANGNYSIGGLKDYKYRVRFSDPNETYATIYYDGQADLVSADTVTITNSAQVSGVDAALTGAGAITGTVTLDSAGLGEDISVVAYRYNGSTWEALGTATTDAAGQYRIGGLVPGEYRLYFQDTTRTYRSEYYNDARFITDGTNVTVTTDTVTPNINVTLNRPAEPLADISFFGNSGSVTTDPWTGEVTITFANGTQIDTTIRTNASCSDGSTPTNVTLWMNSTSYPMDSTSASGIYEATIPVNDITNATLSVRWKCGGTNQEETIGQIVLYDPSGYITDAATGDPVEGARVTLYRVPNWLPDTGGDALNCRTVDTRSGDDWSSEPDASIDLGVVVNPEIGLINGTPEISPTINPQITDGNGYYGWDVVRGCWYVVVQAEGYESRVSPVVGVPPEVTDLDLKLTPLPPVADFAASKQAGQAPLTVVFTDTSTGTVIDRLWNFGDGNSSDQITLTHTYADVGVYSVLLMVSNPSGHDAVTKTNYITVTDTPLVPDVDVDPTSLSATQEEGQTTEQTLTISNNGTADLEWSIVEEEAAARRRPDKPLMQKHALPEGQKVGAVGHSRFAGSQQAAEKGGQLARPVAADDQSLTHSASQEIADLNSTSCQNGNDLHRDNSYYRVFDLSGDFDVNEDFEVSSVEFGVQLARGAGGEQPVRVNLYTLDGSFVLANLTAIGSAEVNLPDQSLTIASVPVSGTVPAGSTLVVELFTPSGVADGNTFFVGSNNQGQTDPSYIRASFCGVSQPTNVTNIGAANMQLVMNVTGDISRGTCSASDIPWVSASPSAGTTAQGNTDEVTLLFNSTGLAAGRHSGQLCIQSNDPDQATVKIPVSLTVAAQDGDFEIRPRYGLNSGPSTMYIYGNDFSEPLTVRLGPTQTLDVDFVRLDEDPQRIRAVVPQTVTVGVYDVTVETTSGRVTLADAYEVLDAVTTDDLLSSGDWMWTEPMPMRVGYANSGLGLNVQHLGGTRTVDTITVTFRLGSPSGPLLGHGYTSPLPPDSTQATGKVAWQPQEPSEPNDDPVDYMVCAIIDPGDEVEETNENNNVICREITVLPPVCLRDDPTPGCPRDSEPPEVDGFLIQDDALSTVDTSVTLDVTATDYGDPTSGVNAIKYIEFEYILGARRWVPIQGQQTWIDYETARLDYPWELIETYGMRYMQAWAADGNRNISFDRERLISLGAGADVIDLVPTVQEDTVRRNDVVFYRILLEEGDSLSATMTPINGGNPDMYVWGPNQSPPWYDPEPDAGTGVEQVQFSAPVKGTYQIEIHGPSDGRANYRLEFGATHLSQQVQPNGLNREPRQVPEDPAVPLDDWPEFYDVGTPPPPTVNPDDGPFQLYLPLVIR